MLKRSLIALVLLAACQPAQAPAPQTDKPSEPAPEQAAASSQLAADEIPAPAGEIALASLTPGAKVKSPFNVEGTVINTWMFEGSFPAELAADGETIVQAPAQQQAPDNWTNPGQVRFKATLEFTVTKETPAVLILKEDMPKPKSADSDEPGPARTLRVPVVLVPGS